jgi:hypothetical protein
MKEVLKKKKEADESGIPYFRLWIVSADSKYRRDCY